MACVGRGDLKGGHLWRQRGVVELHRREARWRGQRRHVPERGRQWEIIAGSDWDTKVRVGGGGGGGGGRGWWGQVEMHFSVVKKNTFSVCHLCQRVPSVCFPNHLPWGLESTQRARG